MNETDQTSAMSVIGARLKDARKAKRLTLSQASKMTGVSISTLSKIENAQVSPSFDVIKKICDGLDMALEEFVRPGDTRNVSGRKTVTRSGEAIQFASGQYDYLAHATELSHKGMVPLEMRIRARATSEFDHWSRHDGEEFVYVLSGAIEIHTEHYAPFRLKQGESAYFDSGMAHLYVSVSKEDAHVLSISYDPNQGRQHVTAFMNASARQTIEAEPVVPIARKVKPPSINDNSRLRPRNVRRSR